MTTVGQSGAGGEARSERRPVKNWADLVPRSVDYEDAMSAIKVKATWEKLYKAADMTSASEDEKSALRIAAYVYGSLNGTSREGDYTGDMLLSTGKRVNASIIPIATSKFNIRKFYRGNMEESYEALKDSRVMENYSRFIAWAASIGVAPSEAFATSDWMADCARFTPAEARAYNASFKNGISRAVVVRGGSLEDVEKKRAVEQVDAQREDSRREGPLKF